MSRRLAVGSSNLLPSPATTANGRKVQFVQIQPVALAAKSLEPIGALRTAGQVQGTVEQRTQQYKGSPARNGHPRKPMILKLVLITSVGTLGQA